MSNISSSGLIPIAVISFLLVWQFPVHPFVESVRKDLSGGNISANAQSLPPKVWGDEIDYDSIPDDMKESHKREMRDLEDRIEKAQAMNG
jgi:hypothetical protein